MIMLQPRGPSLGRGSGASGHKPFESRELSPRESTGCCWLGDGGPPGNDLGRRPGQRAAPAQQPGSKRGSRSCDRKDRSSASDKDRPAQASPATSCRTQPCRAGLATYRVS